MLVHISWCACALLMARSRVPWWWYSWIQSNCKFVIWRLHATQSSSQLSSLLWTQFGQCWGLGLGHWPTAVPFPSPSYWSDVTDADLWLAVTRVYESKSRTSGRFRLQALGLSTKLDSSFLLITRHISWSWIDPSLGIQAFLIASQFKFCFTDWTKSNSLVPFTLTVSVFSVKGMNTICCALIHSQTSNMEHKRITNVYLDYFR